MNGWFKFHRKTFENPMIMKDTDTLSVWIWLLGNATFDEKRVLFGGAERKLKRGELVTTAKFISNELKINESKVNRILKMLESEKQIERQTTSRNTLIYIVNWEKYQSDEKQNDKQMTDERQINDNQVTNNRQTIEEQMTTIQETNKDNNKEIEEDKESKKEKKDTYLTERKQIIEYLNQVCGTNYGYSADYVKKNINARLNEKHTVEEFYTVIDKKYEEWHGTDMEKFLRPQTLFGTKFENYLNQPFIRNKQKENINASKQSQLDYLLNSIREEEMNGHA